MTIVTFELSGFLNKVQHPFERDLKRLFLKTRRRTMTMWPLRRVKLRLRLKEL